MKLTAQHKDENHEISFARDGEHVIAQVDGRSYDVTVREVNDGLFVLMQDGNVYECLVEASRDRQNKFSVHLRNQTYEATLIDPRRLGRVRGALLHAGNGSAEITSPMPGKVVRVLVDEGAHIKAGDGVVVVEAMKMQNELKAPCDGVVAEIRTAEGLTVNSGDVLAIIEPHER